MGVEAHHERGGVAPLGEIRRGRVQLERRAVEVPPFEEPVDVGPVGEQRAVLVQAVGRPVEGDLQLVALAQPRVVVERIVRARLVRVRARVRVTVRVRGRVRGRGRVRDTKR